MTPTNCRSHMTDALALLLRLCLVSAVQDKRGTICHNFTRMHTRTTFKYCGTVSNTAPTSFMNTSCNDDKDVARAMQGSCRHSTDEKGSSKECKRVLGDGHVQKEERKTKERRERVQMDRNESSICGPHWVVVGRERWGGS